MRLHEPKRPRPGAVERLAGPALLALVAACMLAWTWGTWPDPLVDFGRDLYVAWRVAEGEALYRDLAYFNGPLSPYLNAAWLSVFGLGIHALVLLNLLVAIASAAMLYAMLVALAGRWAATVALLVFVTMFSAVQLLPVANYNFLTPYSHEITHGFALCMLGLTAMRWHRRDGRPRWVLLAGVALGLAFLTKAEIFVAGAVGIGLALALALREEVRRAGLRRAGGLAVAFAGSVAAPILAAVLVLTLRLSPGEALRGSLGSWMHVFNREALALDFYRRWMGLLDPKASLMAMLEAAASYLGAIAALLVLAFALGRALRGPTLLAGVAFALAGASSWLVFGRGALLDVGRPLPIVVAAIATGLIIQWRRLPRAHPERPAVELALCFAAFSLALLGKMILNPRIDHYGFVLALPAALVTVAALMSWLPRAILRSPARALAWRAAVLGVIASMVMAHLQAAAFWRGTRSVAVGRGADRLWFDARSASLLADASAALEAELPAHGTFAVLPQGALLNVLLRRPNPTGFVQILPPEIAFFGEARVLEAFRTHPPDAIVLVGGDASGFGKGQFGEGYARELWAWVQAHYRRDVRLGGPRLSGWLLVPAAPADATDRLGRDPARRPGPGSEPPLPRGPLGAARGP